MPRAFLALQSRNFRLLWIGQLISFSGSMMQSAAVLWHVSLLAPPSQKGLALGAVGLVKIVPIVVFSLLSGLIADAFDRRRVMLFAQVGMALVAIALTWTTFAGSESLWPVYLLTAVSSAFGSFDGPARQSLAPTLVPREHLANAISLNTIMVQIASVAGPSLAGLAIAAGGVGWVYAINALSFLAVIWALLAMRGVQEAPSHERADISMKAALDGLRFVFSAPLIRSTMMLDFFATFFSSATALLPIFAQDVLHVGARGYGWLSAAPAVGAVVTSAAMAPLVSHIERRGMVLLVSVGLYGLATVVFGFSTNLWLTMIALAGTGAADTVSTVLRNLIRQLETPDHMRGRMTGVNMVFFMGGPQLGELEAGLVANWMGGPFSVISGGLACMMACSFIGARTPSLRAYGRTETGVRD